VFVHQLDLWNSKLEYDYLKQSSTNESLSLFPAQSAGVSPVLDWQSSIHKRQYDTQKSARDNI